MKRLLKILPLTIVVFVVLFAVYILVPLPIPKPFYIQLDMGGEATATPVAAATVATRRPTPSAESSHALYDMGTRIVNLADTNGRRYLKLAVVLEVSPVDPAFFAAEAVASTAAAKEGKAAAATADAAAAQKLVDSKMAPYKPAMDDLFTSLLSSKNADELFTLDGKNKLKSEMMQKLNGTLKAVKITQLYFTDFLIQ
ncbi:MAG: flagellar basal body-associated FliL family protein [Chloroflexi bacterium]|nr:flagellar basal body-associated FliL family protein [Chloroflexota bacterium]